MFKLKAALLWGVVIFVVDVAAVRLGLAVTHEQLFSRNDAFVMAGILGAIGFLVYGFLLANVPFVRLAATHWLAVLAFSVLVGLVVALVMHDSVSGWAGMFAHGIAMVGVPWGYVAIMSWATRPRGTRRLPRDRD